MEETTKITIHVDGSCRGNLDIARFGKLLYDATGKWINGFYSCIGHTKILTVELLALLQGLSETLEIHLDDVLWKLGGGV
ncbi:hypothetical protein VNO78_23688 [Psophocarpus tetragonolobus]|uniref:RNase H type-1 domain-containing protein n=1 Tax=Psophocarpus tetragonolobus TaxID=3891 RepID=A0AAN9XE84_PSOTE